MSAEKIRIGIVGAGANTRLRHIPGFRAIDGVELTGVVNRTAESTERAANEYGIPKTYKDWRELLADASIDAVMIGTWPNLHCEITCAALAAGKHVLTEARMACNADEAQQMLQAAQSHPELTAQIVPSPFGLVANDYVKELIDGGYLGRLREVVVIGADDSFQDWTKELHWRQDAQISGLNVLTLGILHETVLRWTPAPTRVFAQTAIFEPIRPSPDSDGDVDVTVPECVQIVTQFDGGGRGMYHLSGMELFGPGKQIHLYGSDGTIKLNFNDGERLSVGRLGDTALRDVEIPESKQGEWRVEAEFIGAIRGEEPVRLTDFASGLKYMQFTQAVADSARTNLPVDLA